MDVTTGALASVITKLRDLLSDEYNLQEGLKQEIRFLQGELEFMKAALLKVSDRLADQLQIQDRIWAREARELSYDIEDIIDALMISCKDNKLSNQHGFKKVIHRGLDFLTPLKIRHKIDNYITYIKCRLQELSEQRSRYSIGHYARPVMPKVDPVALCKETSGLVGIDEAREELIQILMEGVNEQEDKIVSIVGFGGIGKTTLAKAVYENLRGQFDCSAFVSVSQTPNIEKILDDMLYQLANKNNARIKVSRDPSICINALREFLKKKRYFIVIDDLWDISRWNVIRCAFRDDNVGSKIIITTRILSISEQVAHATYKLKPLSLNNSRKLFYGIIFGNNENKDNNEDTELAEVSDRILKKCGGVPLAVITMASRLACKPRNEWYEVYNSIGTGMGINGHMEDMRIILSFSYNDLPPHLRTCLLYLSMFPEDYEIDKDRLIWMWIAEGFIQCEKRGRSLFELGESYFKELIDRSMLIHCAYRWSNAMIQYYRVHDIILDFIRSLSRDENFVTVLDGVDHTSVSKKVRRLSLQNSNENDDTPMAAAMNMEYVRSVVVLPSSVSMMPPLTSFKVVRVLDLENSSLSKDYSLKLIGNLFHLRYLGLRGTGINELPREIVLLKHLMCLHIDSWTRMPNGIGSLTSLQVLTTLSIDNFIDIIEELGYLRELRVLGVDCHNGWNFNSSEKSQVECQNWLEKIESLYISVFGECNLDAWDAPQHLRKLEISGCWSSALPAWMKQPSLLQDLSFISIEMGKLCQDDLEILGMLPSLSFLDLEVCHEDLEIPGRFVIGAGPFPSLLHCVLRGSIGPVEFQQGAMPILTSLFLTFPVHETREIPHEMGETAYCNDGFDLGLRNLQSLRDVTISFLYGSATASEGDAEKAEAALRQAIAIHPNHPTLQIH